MGNGISIGWIGWPAMLAVLFGLLMMASVDGPPTHFNATGTSVFPKGKI
jgi:hypothetical protein